MAFLLYLAHGKNNMQVIFWIAAFLLFYTYLGYGLLLLLVNSFSSKKNTLPEDFSPEVTLIIPAYNEEAIIAKKIENCLALNYPPNKLSFLFITDGSVDRTPEIIGLHPEIRLLHQPTRNGKSAAINRAMQAVKTPVVVFSDANTMLNKESVKRLVRHYSREEVGGVSGEKRVLANGGSMVGFGERLYWQYESVLKKANAGFYTLIGAAGELFSIRTALFRPLKENIILDDFVLSASVCQQGFRFLYEDGAYGVEASSSSISEEGKRKVRISAGCFQALFMLTGLLNPFNNFKVAFQYISHRVLRWAVCPLLLPLVFILNFWLLIQQSGELYVWLFCAQSLFYLLAFCGWLYVKSKSSGSILLIPYYFVFMVLSQYHGFYRFMTKAQTVLWEKATRHPVPEAMRQNI